MQFVIVLICSTVAPRVGAWIEMLANRRGRLRTWSLPAWERGLKFDMLVPALETMQSLPAWERGLKSPSYIPPFWLDIVAPRVGAWIEIRQVSNTRASLTVAPHVGAWIEMRWG